MTWRGNIVEDGTLDFMFTTSVNGVPTVLGGTPALSVYEDNSVTQTTAGITLTVDFDSVVGLNHVRIVLTDAFYNTSSNYMVVITTGTVGGDSVVGHVVGEFSIEHRFNEVNVTQWLGTAVTAATAGRPDVNTAAINNATVVGDGNATPWDGA